MIESPRLVQVRQKVLKRNDEVARELRARFRAAGVYVVSLVSSPGSGKTEFLEQILSRLRDSGFRVAAIVGDLATDRDAQRLSRSQVPVHQIVTGSVCHLEAEMIAGVLDEENWSLTELDFLFIENVGNLVCPASFDLGEELRMVLFSVTEGEDKPRKYPTIFNTADLALITKIDLDAAVGFDAEAAHESVHSVRPGMPILELSARTGEGLSQVIQLLATHRSSSAHHGRNAAPPQA